MKALLKNYGGVADKLKAGEYAAPALVPASPWLEKTPPSQPSVYLRSEEEADEQTLHWEPEGKEKVWLWVVQTCVERKWQTHILPSSTTHLTLKSTESIEQVAVSAVDRCGNQGASAMLDISASRK